MKYKLTPNAPKPIDDLKYKVELQKEFLRLLEEHSTNERAFQELFEKNPGMLPGAKSEFDGFPSGHGPYRQTLISQPKISGLANRQPDFLWISYDSCNLSPVLIEIEAPSKKYFNKNGTPTSNLKNAINQLQEWKAILKDPVNVQKFCIDYDLRKLGKLTFEPYYLLIYGRREEYLENEWLTRKRAQLLPRNEQMFLMSYDRLLPVKTNQHICCTVKNGIYRVKYLPPNFSLHPYLSDFRNVIDFEKAVAKMQFTSDDRKKFLNEKIPYWLKFINSQESKKVWSVEEILMTE
jgi:hypothetical protein